MPWHNFLIFPDSHLPLNPVLIFIASMDLHVKPFSEEIESSFASITHPIDAFVAISYDYSFLFLNQKAVKFYKRSKSELIGKKVEDIFPEQWNFGPFKSARQSVDAKKYVAINYFSPFANEWVQLVGRPFENYYTFTYRSIDHKEVLKNELRKEVGRNQK